MALIKATEVTLLTIVSTASNDKTIGSAIDVSTYYEGDIRVRMGRATGTAFTAAPTIRLQKTYKTSPTANDWVSEIEFSPDLGSSIASQAVSGTVNAGATTFGVAASTNFAAGDFIFLHNTTIGNSEWMRLISISGTTITPAEATVFAQTGSTCRDQSQEWTWTMSLLGIQKLRIVVDGSNSGQAVIVEAAMGAITSL